MKSRQMGLVFGLIAIAALIAAALIYSYRDSEERGEIYPENEVLARVESEWQRMQIQVPIRPTFHNQEENERKIWRSPQVVQFLGNNNIFVRFEDDNDVHIAVFNYDGEGFELKDFFRSIGRFPATEWRYQAEKYGNQDYEVATYTKEIVRGGEIVSFSQLTKVPENLLAE